MPSRRFRSIVVVLLLAPLVPGCGGSMYESPAPPPPGEEPFIAKGKLKSDMEAKAKMKAKADAAASKKPAR